MTRTPQPVIPFTRLIHILLALCLLAASLWRYYGIDRLGLWADELWVVMQAPQGTLNELLVWIRLHDNHPPGYYLLSRWSQSLLGASDFAIRLPSLLAGIALVFFTWIAGRKHYSAEAALIAVALVAGSWPAIYYSQEARPNILCALFSLTSFHYARAVLLEGDNARKNILLFWASAVFASYLHYAGLVFVACLGIVWLGILLVRRSMQLLQRGLVLFSVPLLACLPWLPAMWYQMHHTPVTGWQRTPTLATLDQTLRLLLGPDLPGELFYVACFAVLLLLIVLSLMRRQQIVMINMTRHSLALLGFTAVMIVMPVMVFFVKSLYSQDAYNHRHFLFVIPLAALLAGYSIHLLLQQLELQRRELILAVIVITLLAYALARNISGGLYTSNHFKQDYREAVKVVAADKPFLAEPAALLVTSTPFFNHYLDRQLGRTADAEYSRDVSFAAMQQNLQLHQGRVFYYLEAPEIPAANDMITERDLELIQHYQPVCRTKLLRTQVFKFRLVEGRVSLPEQLPDCRQENSAQE